MWVWWCGGVHGDTNHCVKESKSVYKLSLPRVTLREGNGTPLQYSCLENPKGGGAWKAAVHGVTTSRTRLSNFTFIFHFHALEKEMATHSSILAWRIPGTGEPGGLPSMVSQSRTRLKWFSSSSSSSRFTLPDFNYETKIIAWKLFPWSHTFIVSPGILSLSSP